MQIECKISKKSPISDTRHGNKAQLCEAMRIMQLA